ncbi:hypothetical protein FB45DRAFT_1033340 [Roridomyces roridus]|uniref:CxC2-like cysteine cluster KDZ transposase-associated domain-containing protein n=1 Tax=Roridomyces roridus TaxID=1738132 RepID=A0AAD7BFG6_9AGAR|nr:hypothetical protein FB45DRAFT_1033340 [Roridomyces roridus]
MHHGLDAAFQRMALVDEPTYFGDLNVKYREDVDFYVVIRGFVPGVYDTWDEAGPQTSGFSGAIHKKHRGWTKAVAAWNRGFRKLGLVPPSNSISSVTHPSSTASSALSPASLTPSTPSTARHVAIPPVNVARTETPSTPSHRHRATRRATPSSSVPSTPTRSHDPAFFVVSGREDASIYMDRDAALRTTLGRVADGSLRAVDVTRSVERAFDQAEASSISISHAASSSPPTTSVDLDDEGTWEDIAIVQQIHQPRTRKRKRYAASDDALKHWVHNYRDEYLRVLMTREGLMGEGTTCSCGLAAEFRCTDCFGGQLLCTQCMMQSHRARPLCRIEKWNGGFFERFSLRRLGLRVQLGHSDNQACPRARRGYEKFVVINTNGFHHVSVDFCACAHRGSQPHWEQLLSYGWYPSTPDIPQSAVTISCLKLFHALSLQGKTTTYHFFHALAKVTENMGASPFKAPALPAPTSYCMGNDPNRLAAETEEGELGVDCVACPKAGVNLTRELPSVLPEERYLFTIFLAIDACFRLKRKKISSWAADPSIQDGWAYFVKSAAYMEYVKMLGDQKEMSTCTGLAALDHANTKYSQGYAATGCGMITCGRHEVVCKNGVGDLQAGEKYGNMDYIAASALRHFIKLLFFLFSYDIMCQWSKKLKERLLALPAPLRFHLANYFVKYVIPKLHILGHLKWCQDFFSLLYTLGSGQSDMEGIERIWAYSGPMGASTREMGPGSRQDTLDDFWHGWNWSKVVGMGETLRLRLVNARKELARQEQALEEFSAAQHSEVPAWKKSVDDFETGRSDLNPYEIPHAGPTLRDVQLELTREEQEREQASTDVSAAGEDTMVEYLILGLEIEGQQRQLTADLSANRSPTSSELTAFVTRRLRIARQIKKLRAMQRKYSPGALQRLASQEATDTPEAERTPLFLPSALPPLHSAPPLSGPGLAAAEARLRDSQCAESLEAVRNGLIVKRRLYTYKNLHARRQHQSTRSRSLVDNQQRKIELAAAVYQQARAARLALVHVAGPADWKELLKADLRLPEDEEEAKRRQQRAMKGKRREAAEVNAEGEVRGVPGMGEKSRLVSWIWMRTGCTDGVLGEEIHSAVRVEWSKAYARVKRWREEEKLLQEEMVRCLLTLGWQAKQWDARGVVTHYTGKRVYSDTHAQGAMVYAARQAAIRRQLAGRFERLWWPLTCRVRDLGREKPSAPPHEEEEWVADEGDEEQVGALEDGDDQDREDEDVIEADKHTEEDGAVGEEPFIAPAEMDQLLAVQSDSFLGYEEL